MLHLRCGTDILAGLAQAGIPGTRLSWADPLCEGPLLPGRRGDKSRRHRATYLSRYGVSWKTVYGDLTRADRALERAAEHEEVVLWFEADLFDQAILACLLAELQPIALTTPISLICIGSFPGVTRFIGLGQLDPEQLGSLWPGRRPVTPGQFRQAARAWTALTSSDPLKLVRESRKRGPLVFLPAALRRYLAEFPSNRTGLSRTETMALRALGQGPRTPVELFLDLQARERRPFLGDLMFFARLHELGTGKRPALAPLRGTLPRPFQPAFRDVALTLTDEGDDLLRGDRDWVPDRPVSRWQGGVRVDRRCPWRYDPARRTMVRTRAAAGVRAR